MFRNLLYSAVLIMLSWVIKAQENTHPLSYETNKGTYDNDRFAASYYRIKKYASGYQLLTKHKKPIFITPFDTIIKNQHFIKTVQGASIKLYRTQNLASVNIPKLLQAYLVQDGLEVLTSEGAYCLNNSLERINSFPEMEVFLCGTVFEKRYRLSTAKANNHYRINIQSGHSGEMISEKELLLKGVPEAVDSISFVNDSDYISQSVNNAVQQYPHFVKVVKNNLYGLFTYNLAGASYFPKKEKDPIVEYKVIVDGDTLYEPLEPSIIELEDFLKEKGEVILIEVLPLTFDYISQHPENGLIYLKKGEYVGFYPNHMFSKFQKETNTFYSIVKDGKSGWIDLKTFKEYYSN